MGDKNDLVTSFDVFSLLNDRKMLNKVISILTLLTWLLRAETILKVSDWCRYLLKPGVEFAQGSIQHLRQQVKDSSI